jgi:hypothetical protein
MKRITLRGWRVFNNISVGTLHTVEYYEVWWIFKDLEMAVVWSRHNAGI